MQAFPLLTLLCLVAATSGHADVFVSSPDTNVQLGYSPDLGFYNFGMPRTVKSFLDLAKADGGNVVSNTPSPLLGSLISKRLRALASRVSASLGKDFRSRLASSRSKAIADPSRHPDIPLLFDLFTGAAKDAKRYL